MRKAAIIVNVILFWVLSCCCMVSVFSQGDRLFINVFPSQFILDLIKTNMDRLRGDSVSEAEEAQFYEEYADQNLPSDISDIARRNLINLSAVEIPVRDPVDLAYRLRGKTLGENVKNQEDSLLELGQRREFWVSNSDTNQYFQIYATLKVISDHAYFWVADNVQFNQDKLEGLAKVFDEKIYPNTRDFFGSEWTPGIDNDERIYVLFAKGIGSMVAGYFSSTDEEPPAISEYSNGHELFILNPRYLRIGNQDTEQVLAHEFQHMIQWNIDKNEDTWLNEGFSELAGIINGYPGNGFDRIYGYDSDTQLNAWTLDDIEALSHYGASYLFVLYFLERFGEEMTQELIHHPENGLESVDTILRKNHIIDHHTGKILSTEDVFMDWVIANYLNDPSLDNGQYGYSSFPDLYRPKPTETVRHCPTDWNMREVSQFGVDYVRINCSGEYVLEIQGLAYTPLFPVESHSGRYVFWSNRGDESDMTLTRLFDFHKIQGDIVLKYWVWYDLEKDYDYVYLLASDDGMRWEIVKTQHNTSANPMGNSFGWAYNGTSEGWFEDRVDLSKYAGKQIYIRFEYITDSALNGEGFLIDDLSISSIPYETGFEEEETGWIANGFVRVANILPQDYAIAVIDLGENPVIKKYSLDKDYVLSIPLNIYDKDGCLFVIGGITRYTRQFADYRYRIRKP